MPSVGGGGVGRGNSRFIRVIPMRERSVKTRKNDLNQVEAIFDLTLSIKLILKLVWKQ